jgi:hypothetical protein
MVWPTTKAGSDCLREFLLGWQVETSGAQPAIKHRDRNDHSGWSVFTNTVLPVELSGVFALTITE